MSELHVIFGTGPLGIAVAQTLTAQGKAVRMVNRKGKADAPAGAVVVRGDGNDVASAREVCAGATVVYQCAQPAYTRWVEEFPKLQATIIEGAAAAGAKLVAVENLYMYGHSDAPLREDMPFAATTRKGRLRAQLAEALMDAHRRGTVRATAGRGSDFYGPLVLGSSVGERFFGPLVAGKAAQAVGNPDLPHALTYIEDFGRALVTLGERDEALGQAWHVPNPPTITIRQLAGLAGEVLGRTPKVQAVGALMLRLVGLFIPEAGESVEMMYEFTKPFLVDHSRFERAFGATVTPHAEAVRRTVAWYQQHLAAPALAH
jgi:nucleoside-diphosphate-sugar epimerase